MSHFVLCWIAFILLIPQTKLSAQAQTIDTPIYPLGGSTSTEYSNQGKIYQIEWGIAGCIGGIEALKTLKWNGGTGTEGCTSGGGQYTCTTVNLAADEYINAYRVKATTAPVAVWFRSNKNTEYQCGPYWSVTYDSGWIEHTNHYLSGFKYTAGWIVETIGFQFTEYPSVSPTNAPIKSPTLSPTNIPTHIPTEIPTNIPTFIPTNIPTINPTYNPTNIPTFIPTNIPTNTPTFIPTFVPSNMPTNIPTSEPTIANPTNMLTDMPTKIPTNRPIYTGGEGGVSDEMSTTVNMNDSFEINLDKHNEFSFVLVIIIVSCVIVSLCVFIVIIFVVRNKKSNANATKKSMETGTAQKQTETKMPTNSTFSNIGSVSSINTYTTVDGLSPTSTTELMQITNSFSVSPKQTQTEQTEVTEGMDNNTINTSGDCDIVQEINQTKGATRMETYETPKGDFDAVDDIVNVINKTKENELEMEVANDTTEYEYYYEEYENDNEVLQNVNETRGFSKNENEDQVLENNGLCDDEFEVIDDGNAVTTNGY